MIGAIVEKPAIMLVDLRMPAIAGLQLLKILLRALAANVVLTASSFAQGTVQQSGRATTLVVDISQATVSACVDASRRQQCVGGGDSPVRGGSF
ncbi:hypothetical protein [Rhizobium sp. ERR 1071]|uniref:hypothetical protein n=1 Tax=Rhizobium sp. ERR 1071 TaxID=2572677 RepID=UPI0011A5C6AE|nr:hypothetical protein [Rhizobium sp. ERR1071]